MAKDKENIHIDLSKDKPSVIVPDKSFLIGSIQGFNAGRREIQGQNIEPMVTQADSEKPETNTNMVVSSYLDIHCAKCGAFYPINSIDEIPSKTMFCSHKQCKNPLIVYCGWAFPEFWHLGGIKL